MAIQIDILRHGKALPVGSAGDRSRSLSPEGIRSLAALAERLEAAAWRPDRVFTSPYDRARQSAEIVAGATPRGLDVEALASLEPDREPTDVMDSLARLGITEGHVLLVGHQPLLGRLVGWLTGTDRDMSPGMMVRIDCLDGACPRGGRVTDVLAPEG
jgi:phosphohistidine phosphatase